LEERLDLAGEGNVALEKAGETSFAEREERSEDGEGAAMKEYSLVVGSEPGGRKKRTIFSSSRC
jgi:hypothetical protein